MSLIGGRNKGLEDFDREDESQPPNAWEVESPAESQELRWENEESGEVIWVESETDTGSPYAIFYTESSEEVADVFDKGFEDLDEVETEVIKIMEDIESNKGGDE